MSRNSVAVETRRHLQEFPQFKAETVLPEQLRELLARLERAEGAER